MAAPAVGSRIKRREDPRLITGTGNYVEDVTPAGTLYMALARSPHAHARLRRVNVKDALQHPGVVAALTGPEVRQIVDSVPCVVDFPDLKKPKWPVLAVDRVRYVGEAVAAVVATDRAMAVDAASLVQTDYLPLTAVTDPERALRPRSTRVHAEFKDNQAWYSLTEAGDVDSAFREAHVVVKQRLVNQRLIPLAMETRGVVAQYHAASGLLTVWSTSQNPHQLKSQLAALLGLPENQVRVIAPDVGGGFGSKIDVYCEEILACIFALRLGRPVKWIEERRENFQGTIHGRDQVDYVEVAAQRDGVITGLKVKVIADVGAYWGFFSPAIATSTIGLATGCYAIPNFRGELYEVFTNKTPVDAYRGAGRPEAAYIIERAVDLVALELALDPAEVRRKNFIGGPFPYATAGGMSFDSGNYRAALDKALQSAGYQRRRSEQKRLRQRGRYQGIGLSSYIELCAIGPWEMGAVRVDAAGKVTVLTGTSPHGQGEETTFAQIVADQLQVAVEEVAVQHGDTAVVPAGIGTYGSRTTAVGGSAVLNACLLVKEKAFKIASHLLQVPEDRLTFAQGTFAVKDAPDRAVTLAKVAAQAYTGSVPGAEMGLEASAYFEAPNLVFPFGTHVAVVEVDPETGEVKLVRYVAVDDAGNIINPLTAEGQVHGGIAQGVGQALMEAAVYDESGQLVTGTLMDYAIPAAEDLPLFETAFTVTPTPRNPLGAKGIGEAGTIGATPAVVNAVMDALAPFGIRHIDMPLSPERVWRAIQESAKARPARRRGPSARRRGS
ncbi:MAG: xanthine dehydrogenase family protein molybdopterin-binding subunit [Dehalococcoidia bacterium]|nr:xanthine dehydrogenase family protein molybdopterin-binding subunit [Dehalococcoidia bacterium]